MFKKSSGQAPAAPAAAPAPTPAPAPAAPPALVAQWWAQAVEQSRHTNALPVLFYRADRAGWRVVWPAGLHITPRPQPLAPGFDDTLTGDPLTWWRLVRGLAPS